MIDPGRQQVALPHGAGVESVVHGLFRDRLQLDVEVDTDVIVDGMLDSLGFVQLLLALEETFGIKVDLSVLELDEFSSVASVARLVKTIAEGAT